MSNLFKKVAMATATASFALCAGAALPVSAQEAEKQEIIVNGQGRIATEVFAQIPFMYGVRISPDGRHAFANISRDGQEYYAILDLTGKKAPPKFIASAGEFRNAGDRTVAGVRWVGKDHVVLTLISREYFFGERGDVSRLIGYNINTGKAQPLAWEGAGGAAANILYVDHDNGTFLLQRQNLTYASGSDKRSPEVVQVDVESGKLKTVMRPNVIVGAWAADGNGVIRAGFGYDPDNGKRRVLYRSGDSGNLKTVYNKADEDFTGAGIEPQIFLDEPDMAIVTSNKDGVTKVYKANMETMELGEELFGVDGYDIGGAIANKDDNAMIGVSYVTDRSRTKWFDPKLKAIQEQVLDPEFGEANARIISADEDYNRLILYIAKQNQSGGYYLYDVTTGDFGLLGWYDDNLRDYELNPVKMITYPASDGEKIEAVLTMPRHRVGQKNLPVVMITHGGPFGPRDNAEYNDWAQAMAELGYVVVQPNYRGSGGYGAEWIKKGRDDGFGLRMQDDLNDAIDYLAAEGIVDKNRACMMGWSYGGYASARAAQRDPDRWRCTIAGAGVYDLRLMREYDVGYLGRFGSNYLAKGAADLEDVSPASNASGDWSPILIVHGVRDSRVPVEQARVLVSALKSAGKVEGKDFKYIEQPENTHNLPYNDVRIEWLKGAEDWLAKHNPAYIDSDPDKQVPVRLDLK